MNMLASSSTNCDLPAESIAAFVQRVYGGATSFEGHEKRVDKRYVVAIPSIVQPLDESFQHQGGPCHAATRDISVAGIGLLQVQPVTAKYLEVTLLPPNGRESRVFVKVLRCAPFGAYFDIAGEFVTIPGLELGP